MGRHSQASGKDRADMMPITDPANAGMCAERLQRFTRWGADLVQSGKLAGLSTLVYRRGQVVNMACHGEACQRESRAIAEDTLFRIYSMTKPITSVAAMMLYEEARFQLDDPISNYLPAFKNMQVLVAGSRTKLSLEPARRGITVRDLLTHRAGFTYGFMEATPVDALYRAHGVDFSTSDATLAEVVDRLAGLPLLSHPGDAWQYSVCTDVLGHYVAAVSGMAFDDFLRTRIFDKLGMDDTFFCVPEEKRDRFATNYTRHPESGALTPLSEAVIGRFTTPRAIASGGGGLVSTAGDYLRFCRMLLGQGAVDGVRLLSPKTVSLMLSDHCGPEMVAAGLRRLSGGTQGGIGFGLGFAVLVDPAAAQIIGSVGEAAWSGAASTGFFIDPSEDMAVILMTQFMPSGTYPLLRDMRVLSYQAITA
jgi:CubicO group peptidase (beta-lactamase class C family)